MTLGDRSGGDTTIGSGGTEQSATDSRSSDAPAPEIKPWSGSENATLLREYGKSCAFQWTPPSLVEMISPRPVHPSLYCGPIATARFESRIATWLTYHPEPYK